MKQLLTPAPDTAAIAWKRAALKSGKHRFTDVKAERIERAIASDVEWLAAHPTAERATERSNGRAELVAAIGSPCAYCGDPMTARTRDHIRPPSKGGTLAPENSALACDPCNTDKGSRTAGSWLHRLRSAGARRAVFVAAIAGTISERPPASRPGGP